MRGVWRSGTAGSGVNPSFYAEIVTLERARWLDGLPASLDDLERRWSLTSVGEPFEASCAWVAAVRAAEFGEVVLKIPLPHMEARDEIAGLRLWDGDASVRLLAADEKTGAMLLERCRPGTSLRELPEPEQDVVIARLIGRLWRMPPPGIFRPLTEMVDFQSREVATPHPLAIEGLRVAAELAGGMPSEPVLLTTDLHAGNVLRAEREPWLAIDPKPFVGDPAYDATQHLLNCRARVDHDPPGTIGRMADLCGLDAERVRLWLFIRAAYGPPDWNWLAPKLAVTRA